MGHFIRNLSGGMPLFFYFLLWREALSTAKRGVDQQMQIWCLKGLGATPNKPSGASCLDTDIACQFVKNSVEVRFLGQEMLIMDSGRKVNQEIDNRSVTEGIA